MSTRGFWIGLVIAALLLLALHAPSVRAPHHEGDEAVLTFLAERLRQEPLRYSVEGTLEGEAARRFISDTWVHVYGAASMPESERAVRALERVDRVELSVDPLRPQRVVYDPKIYDHPVFIHPPAYPVFLTLFRTTLGSAGGPLLSILIHLVTVLALAKLGRIWFGPRVGLIAGILVAIDPVTWLAGSHLWTDGMLELTVVLTMLTLVTALRSGRTAAFALAGITFSAACVTKYPAILMAPAMTVAWLLADRRPSRRQLVAVVAGSLSLIGPWLIAFRIGYGAWLPVTKPTLWLMETYPYIKMMVARPWQFYVTGLALVAPVTLFSVAVLPRLRRGSFLWIPLTWALSVAVVMTVLGLTGHGMQLRYLGPGMPAICLLAACGIAGLRSPAWIGVALAAAFVTLASSLANAGMAEPFPSVVVFTVQRMGLPIDRWLGGMW